MIDLITVGKARQLASFLHRHSDVAMEVTASATAGVEPLVMKQNRRCTYRPKKQHSKVSLSSMHLLQYLVYSESESHERLQEASASEEMAYCTDDLLIRYVKHLVQISLLRNSFYVTLAVCKFLYNYSTEETMAIYDLVSQSPRHEAYYYRSRKAVLLRELESRFGSLLNKRRGARGEVQIQCDRATRRQTELVRDCLTRFTPWNTRCVVPVKFDPMNEELSDLCCSHENSLDEDSVEVNRIHAVLHPECFSRLTRALDLDPPEKRLTIPRFFDLRIPHLRHESRSIDRDLTRSGRLNKATYDTEPVAMQI